MKLRPLNSRREWMCRKYRECKVDAHIKHYYRIERPTRITQIIQRVF